MHKANFTVCRGQITVNLGDNERFDKEQIGVKEPRTTDAQRGNSLHCTAKTSIPIPNFLVWPKHIWSDTF